MTYEVTNSRKGTSIVRAEGPATYTIQLTDLSASAQETITSASLRRITWSTNGSITISRTGGPTLLSLYQTGDMKFDEFGYAISNTSTANIVCTIATGGSIIMEVSKHANYANDVYSQAFA
jgi:hypothetical protein